MRTACQKASPAFADESHVADAGQKSKSTPEKRGLRYKTQKSLAVLRSAGAIIEQIL